MAEREGFEPPCRLPDKTLSRRPRYDHFGTSPWGAVAEQQPFIIPNALGSGLAAAAPFSNRRLHQRPAVSVAHTGHHRHAMIVAPELGAVDG